MAVYTPQGRQGQPPAHHRWQDWVNLVLGICLIAVSLLTAFADDTAVRLTLCGTGIAVAAFSLWALASPLRTAPEWLNMVAALWLFLSPWIMHYEEIARFAAGFAWGAGAIIFVLAIWASDRADGAFRGHPSS